ncbi:hypothetical protein [Massilia rubra]|uniref:Uncharacterized protein n=1 Tax=Massilia rubra TaxID=2607910 RepID=A0ABX0LLP1_9BURK|nr:hypothetical protein [Massilia rubra]NHZ33152.1 hypothetical protein [Massilia rubra]
MKQYYFDYDEGMNRDNCHPRFAKLASEDFYYNECDDFSPFGSDTGHDTLTMLQDWYQEGGRDRHIASFVRRLFADWDCPIPKGMWRAQAAEMERWLALDELNERFLTDEWRVRVATAFGQLRISGDIDGGMLEEALMSNRFQLWFNERARTTYPKWEYADVEKERLLAMRAVLKQCEPVTSHDFKVGDLVRLIGIPDWLIDDLQESEQLDVLGCIGNTAFIEKIDEHGCFWVEFGKTAGGDESARHSCRAFAIPADCLEHC